MPRQENEAEEIEGLIGGLALLAMVCTAVLALGKANTHMSEEASIRPSVSQSEKFSD
ncbi:MAG: hypothetical protein ACRBBV_17730 [Paracoccaceae bacterium]